MKISVDNSNAIARDIEHAKEIIKEYETSILAKNRVISHYLVDGVEVADIDSYLTNQGSLCTRNIIIVTRTPEEMVQDSIGTFLDYIPALEKGLLSIKEKLTMGEFIPQNDWHSLLDGLDWTSQLLNSLKNLVHVKGVSLEDIATRWHKQLMAMLTAWESGDTVLMADIMEYEIIEVLREAKSYFEMYLLRKESH